MLPNVSPEDACNLKKTLEIYSRAAHDAVKKGEIPTDWYALSKIIQQYNLFAVAGRITCPMLVTQYEGDTFFTTQGHQLFDALKVKNKKLVEFTSVDGAQHHCGSMAPELVNETCWDWLDDVFDRSRRQPATPWADAMRAASRSRSGLSSIGSGLGQSGVSVQVADSRQDRGAADQRQDLVPLDVVQRAPTERLVLRDRCRRGRGSRRGVGRAAFVVVDSSVVNHATSCSGAPIDAMSQSSTARGTRSSPKITLPSRTSPHSSTGSDSTAGRCARHHSSASTSAGTGAPLLDQSR